MPCVIDFSFCIVCCIDECEGLLGHIERHVAAPTARPAQLIQIVSSLSSDTALRRGTSPFADSISDPDAREMAERADQSESKLVDAGPFVEQDFKDFAAKAGVPVDNLDAEQVAYCSKAAFQLLKAFGFDAKATVDASLTQPSESTSSLTQPSESTSLPRRPSESTYAPP